MQDKDFLFESYRERLWQYQVKEINRSYKQITVNAIKIGILVGVFTGAVVAVVLTILMR